MVSTAANDLSSIAKPKLIGVCMLKLPPAMHHDPDHDLAISFDGLNSEEVRTLIDCAIKIEQARTGDVLSPTDYGERFTGIDM
jgi:hypothetical protein